MGKKLPLSISMISFNEERNIARTIEAITDIAAEIIVVDSHSIDKTRELAEQYDAKVYVEDWKGFVEQKNSALEKCTQPWILFLDCDEVVSDELKESIIQAIQKGDADGYWLNRKTFYLGKLLNYAWQPDWNLRLVRKDANPIFKGLDVHEYIEIEGKTAKLKGDLLHYSFTGIMHHFSKLINYARISAESYYKNGKRFSVINLIFNPVIAFIKLYFIHLGFLDGVRGLIVAVSAFLNTFLKYSFLFEKELKKTNTD